MNWKTTISAVVSAGAGFVAFCGTFYPDIHMPRMIVAAAAFVCAGGLASFGITAKDAKG